MKVSIIEQNQRRDGLVIVNGYKVDLEDLQFSGSENQGTLAKEIIETEVRVMVESFVAAKSKRAGHDSSLLTEEEAKSWLAEVNSTLATQVVPKLQRAPAGKIIEAGRIRAQLPEILKTLAGA